MAAWLPCRLHELAPAGPRTPAPLHTHVPPALLPTCSSSLLVRVSSFLLKLEASVMASKSTGASFSQHALMLTFSLP
jgi:hypothetical protein